MFRKLSLSRLERMGDVMLAVVALAIPLMTVLYVINQYQ